METRHDITQLLAAYGEGDREAFDRLVPLVYEDLRKIARRQMRRSGPGQTLNTTGLVHEAYLKMVDQKRSSWKDRNHFLAVSACAMRQVLIGYARKRTAAKRGGDERPVTLEEGRIAVDDQAAWLLDVDEALERLGKRDPRLVRVVECRFFGGLSEEETAEALGVSVRTVQRDWRKARAWLQEELRQGGAGRDGGGRKESAG